MTEAFVSTGRLPVDVAQGLVDEALERFRGNDDGETSRIYPALERVPRQLFGICVVGTDGRVFSAGDAERESTLMSVAKPFVFALVCDSLGAEEAREKLGVNATGLPFNSPAAIEASDDGRTNPMVNPGAIAATSLAGGWDVLQQGLSRFAGRRLSVDEEVYDSASETNHRNRELTRLLESRGRIYSDPAEALDLYTRQSALSVTAKDLAAMGATLADGGVHPLTRTRVVSAETCRYTLAVMATAGLYETSGDWLDDVGLPGKSGIGGGILTVSPGKGGLGTFAPPLDEMENSVKGQLVARFLSRAFGMDVFASIPKREGIPPGH